MADTEFFKRATVCRLHRWNQAHILSRIDARGAQTFLRSRES
jgi:hypothetical protein